VNGWREERSVTPIVLLLQSNSLIMTSFYPGPSQVHDKVPQYVKEAYRKGILSLNHRSDEFMALYKKTDSILKDKLDIPVNYSILFTSSATECWEILAQSIVKKESLHIYNGAFGEKWFDYSKRLNPDARAFIFDQESELNPKDISFSESELICITQNETSNGTQISNELIASIQMNNPKSLIAVDATSSMAGIELDFQHADIWFASVQKCFGLPAGLAILVCSPKAIKVIKSVKENKHYNSLAFMNEMMEKWQTSYTPNVLGIYLLMRVLKDSKKIRSVHKQIEARAKAWYEFFKDGKNLKCYIQNQQVLSRTVITITGSPGLLNKVKTKAKKKGFVLGEGYGKLKSVTCRIANFPALKKIEIKRLKDFLEAYR
jgi:phosphoserine aminotransferase